MLVMKTTDIWFASYLQFKGFQLIDFEVISRGRGKYDFKISPEQWKNEKLAYSNSETSRIKTNFTGLKDLLF